MRACVRAGVRIRFGYSRVCARGSRRARVLAGVPAMPCVCVRARVHVRACVRAFERARVRAYVRACMCVYTRVR